MEILKTIWMALTNENERLITIFSLPLCLLDTLIGMLLFTTLLDIKSSKKQKLIYVFSFGTLAFLFRTFIPNPYGTLFNMLFCPFFVIYIFKIRLFKAIACELIPYSLTIVVEITIEKIIYIVTSIPVTSLLNIPVYRFLIIGFVYATLYLFYRFIKKIHFSISLLETMNKKYKYILILNCILALAVIFSQFYLLNFYVDNFPIIVSLLNVLGLIAYFIISFVGFMNITKLDSTTTSLEEATLYNKTLEIMYDNTRAFKHDFGNIMQGIGGYIVNNDMEGLQQYYSQLSSDCNHINNLSNLNPEKINNSAIFNVLAEKYHKADAKNIKITLESSLDFSNLQMKIYEFTRILGILMDNAIEATSECKDKIIHVYFGDSTDKQMQLVIIENTYMNKEINTETIFQKGYSTKSGNSGLGLWEVRQLLSKNHNLNLFTSKTSDFFRQQLEIYYE